MAQLILKHAASAVSLFICVISGHKRETYVALSLNTVPSELIAKFRMDDRLRIGISKSIIPTPLPNHLLVVDSYSLLQIL